MLQCMGEDSEIFDDCEAMNVKHFLHDPRITCDYYVSTAKSNNVWSKDIMQ